MTLRSVGVWEALTFTCDCGMLGPNKTRGEHNMADLTLEERIQRMEDIEEIKQLKAQYCAGCDDDHNSETICALFVEDGVWDWEQTAYCDGKAQIKEFMDNLRASGRIRNSAHMVTNPQIEVNGDRATAHWRFIMLHTDNVPGQPDRDNVQHHRIIGYYQDDHVKVDGKWYFQTLRPRVEENAPYTLEDDLLAQAAE